MLLKRKKIREEKVNKTKENMLEFFKNNMENYDKYNLVYGYNRDFSNEIMDYIYTSLVIGYDIENLELIIIETDKDFNEVFNITKLKRNNFTKAIYSPNLEEYRIYLSKKKKNCLKFNLVKENYIDIDILAFIEQEFEIEDFNDFYLEFKRKPHIKKKKLEM